MKTNESVLHKGLRAIVQAALRHEAVSYTHLTLPTNSRV